MKMCAVIYLPEDPVKSIPAVSYFFIFSEPPARDNMSNMIIFFENLEVLFYAIKTGKLTSEFDFLILYPIFSWRKLNSNKGTTLKV